MAEYVMGQDENRQQVARDLLAHAGDRAGEIQWVPRPNVEGGGVFQIPDDVADGFGSDRITRFDQNATGAMRAANRPGEEDELAGEPANPTDFNTALLNGEAMAAASPASGPNPLVHGITTNESGQVVADGGADGRTGAVEAEAPGTSVVESEKAATKGRSSRRTASTNNTE